MGDELEYIPGTRYKRQDALFDSVIELKKKDGYAVVQLYIVPEALVWHKIGDESRVHHIPMEKIRNCRGAKDTAKEAKLQIIAELKDKEIIYTFQYRGSDPWSEMRSMRDIVVNLMYKGSTPDQRNQHYAQLTPEQKGRLKALDADPRLRETHENLVGGGTLTDDEFWEQHKSYLPLKEAREQQPGVSASLLDAQEQTNIGANTVTFTLTPEIITAICRLYPAVKRAYQESVPTKMTEQEFWKRYLQSQRFHERNAGIKSDDIFTRAHNEETRAFKEKVTKKVSEIEDEYDLMSDSMRDYMVEEGPNLADPGASKLLTQVNSQSNRVLEVTEGDEETLAVRKRGVEQYLERTELADLIRPRSSPRAKLRLDDDVNYFQAFSGDSNSTNQADTALTADHIQSFQTTMSHWTPQLEHIGLWPAFNEAVKTVDSLMIASEAARGKDIDISNAGKEFLRQYQTTLQELLRHYWSSMPVMSLAIARKVVRVMTKLEEETTTLHTVTRTLPDREAKMFEPLLRSINIARQHYEAQKQDSSSKITACLAVDAP